MIDLLGYVCQKIPLRIGKFEYQKYFILCVL